MSYRIVPTEKFKKEVKRLLKKFPSLKKDLKTLNEILTKNPESGTELVGGLFKVRMSIKSISDKELKALINNFIVKH